MIGDTITTTDLSAGTGDLPDASAHLTTLTKVNNDGFASQYRFRGVDYDYVLDLRNSKENTRSDGVQFTRHNAAFQLTKRATVSAGIVTPAIPYIGNVTFRMPSTGDITVARALMGHLCTIIGLYGSATTSRLVRMINFES